MEVAADPPDEAAHALQGPSGASQPARPKAKQKTPEQKIILEKAFAGMPTSLLIHLAYYILVHLLQQIRL
jgi:hypothetical protein